MADQALVDRLAAHRTIGHAPRAELEWLVDHGVLTVFETGMIVNAKDQPVQSLFIVLEGHFAIFVDRGSGPQKALEWRGGDIAGTLPYSRMVRPPGYTMTQERTTVLAVHRDHFRELVRECQEVAASLVHVMLDRARSFTSDDLLDEKMMSLGKLSAGLAHELNNPASAIERNANLLQAKLEESESAARALGAARLSDAQFEALDRLRTSCLARRAAGVLSPIEQAEREDELADWLAAHGMDDHIAEALSETEVTTAILDELAAVVSGPALDPVLRWSAAGCSVRALTADIQEAATRIAGLVLAIKGFTHMDQAAVAEPVDLAKGIANTVTVLRAKARGKSASVTIDSGIKALPRVRGFAGELNQIWANLLDNALDAIGDGGSVEVKARREGNRVVVEVADDGPGIPDAIKERIFDPFFTTKEVGHGTGLGLDIVRRLVRHNEGTIKVSSRPGRTTFEVELIVAEGDGAGATA